MTAEASNDLIRYVLPCLFSQGRRAVVPGVVTGSYMSALHAPAFVALPLAFLVS